MTTLTDDSDKPCPQPGTHVEDDVIVVHDRNTELTLMDSKISTCFAGLIQGGRSRRVKAYFHVPTPEYVLRFVLEISGMECTNPSLVVYHWHGNGDITMQCILIGSSDTQEIQKCEFICNNICPQASVATIYVQTQKVLGKPYDSRSICGIRMPK